MDESGDVAMSEGEGDPKTGENLRVDFSAQSLWGPEKASHRHMGHGVIRSRVIAAAGRGAEEMLRSREPLLWSFACCETLAIFLQVSKSQVLFLFL